MESQIQTPIERVLGLLERQGCEPKPSGPGMWRSKCPVHRGKSFNLSVRETSDGTVLLHCHRMSEQGTQTCSADAVMKELGLGLRDLFRRRDRPTREQRKGNPKGKPFPTAEEALAGMVKRLGEPSSCWIYKELHDGSRHELMRVYRFDLRDGTKEFRPVHPSADGWYIGDPPGRLPLYGLPELGPAPVVFVVEGEKCVDLVRSMGLVATTSAHGSKSPAKTEWKPLAGKSVVIIPDNDEPGEAYAHAVGNLVSALDPPATVRILHLPVLEKGHDISEWLNEVVPEMWNLTDCRIELERLLADVPPWQPPPGVTPLPKTQPGHDGPPKLTELGNARRLIKSHGEKIRFNYARGQWMSWDNRRWTSDETGAIWRYAKQIPRILLHEAADTYDYDQREAIVKWALKSEQKKVIEASLRLAWSEEGVGVMPDQFDRDPWSLNTPNGVVDLLTGEIRAQKPEDLLSKMTAVTFDPAHQCPRWLKVLSEVFDGNEELIAYLQRAAGYALSGDISEHAMFLCYGTGRNGKNTVLDTIRDVMGDYASVSDPKIFLTTGQGDHPTGLADLVGRRLIVTSEVDTGQQLAEGLVKRLTGDRTIKARFMHHDWFEFRMAAKIWMLANSKPEIQGQDEGIWSRIRIIPFDTFIPPEKRIKGLSEILVQEEGPGILAWLVEGCREWHRIGLCEPSAVTEATSSYRSEQDVLGDFLQSCCIDRHDDQEVREKYRVEANKLYGTYNEWCKQMGERSILTARRFFNELTGRGFVSVRSNGNQYRVGLALKEAEVEEPARRPAETRNLPY
jgi:putative DNA primase/helicase